MVASAKTLGSALVSLLASMLLACLLISLDSSAERKTGASSTRKRSEDRAQAVMTMRTSEPVGVRIDVAPPEAAGKREAAIAAAEKGDYVTAVALLETAAILGDAHARKLLVEIHLREDPNRAVELLRKEARSGDIEAMRRMAILYEEGRFAPRDDVAAYLWFEAAAQRDRRAAFDANRVQARMSPSEWEYAERAEMEFLRDLLEHDPRSALLRNLEVRAPRLMERTRVEPVYPERAVAERVDGEVILQALVDSLGVPRDLVVLRCNHPGLGFEQAALDAVRQWLYWPAELRGPEIPEDERSPIDVYTTILVEFKLPK